MLYFVLHYQDILVPDEIIEQASIEKPHLLVSLSKGKYTLINSYEQFTDANREFRKLIKARDNGDK